MCRIQNQRTVGNNKVVPGGNQATLDLSGRCWRRQVYGYSPIFDVNVTGISDRQRYVEERPALHTTLPKAEAAARRVI